MPSYRLSTTRQIQGLYKRGKKIRTTHLQWYWQQGGATDRWAIVISTKVSKRSTVRNRLRRILREQLRSWSEITRAHRSAIDSVIVVHKRPSDEQVILQECRQCLQRLYPFQLNQTGGFASPRKLSKSIKTSSRGTTNGVTDLGGGVNADTIPRAPNT